MIFMRNYTDHAIYYYRYWPCKILVYNTARRSATADDADHCSMRRTYQPITGPAYYIPLCPAEGLMIMA